MMIAAYGQDVESDEVQGSGIYLMSLMVCFLSSSFFSSPSFPVMD
jgi:predicted membrane channel-forming protein YqfA (hemolysin III family)